MLAAETPWNVLKPSTALSWHVDRAWAGKVDSDSSVIFEYEGCPAFSGRVAGSCTEYKITLDPLT